jgi:hypothetical protein
MADNKHKLAGLLPDEPVKPVIRRGQGIRLSTDVQNEEHTDQVKNQEMEKSRNIEKEKREKVEREKPGYAIRKDLLLAAKRLALDEDRFNYEVIEEALEEYLKKKGKL